MKKFFLSVVLIFGLLITLNAQKYYDRTNGLTTANDPHLSATLSFHVPTFPDTASANSAFGIDSNGLVFHQSGTKKLWVRDSHLWTDISTTFTNPSIATVIGIGNTLNNNQSLVWQTSGGFTFQTAQGLIFNTSNGSTAQGFSGPFFIKALQTTSTNGGNLTIAAQNGNVTNSTRTGGQLILQSGAGGSSVGDADMVFDHGSTEEGRIIGLNGDWLIGTATDDASAKLNLTSTTKGFLPPRMTTTQKNAISSPAEGLITYDNTLHAPYFYNGSAWTAFGGGSGFTGHGFYNAQSNAFEIDSLTQVIFDLPNSGEMLLTDSGSKSNLASYGYGGTGSGGWELDFNGGYNGQPFGIINFDSTQATIQWAGLNGHAGSLLFNGDGISISAHGLGDVLLFGNTSTANGPYIDVSQSSITVSADSVKLNHIIGMGAAPTTNTLGTNVSSVTISPQGNDNDFQVVVVTSGNVTGTVCHIHFAESYTNEPVAVISASDYTSAGLPVALGGGDGSYVVMTATLSTGTYTFNVHVAR